MGKGIYLLLCMFMLMTLISGGCASNHDGFASSEMQAGDAAGGEKTEVTSASAADDAPIWNTPAYEYETQELYARRDENQIYGLLYVPKNAGEKRDADNIVPLSCSEKAVEAYDSARLMVLPGAGHGFSGEDARRAIDWILEYLNTHRD